LRSFQCINGRTVVMEINKMELKEINSPFSEDDLDWAFELGGSPDLKNDPDYQFALENHCYQY